LCSTVGGPGALRDAVRVVPQVYCQPLVVTHVGQGDTEIISEVACPVCEAAADGLCHGQCTHIDGWSAGVAVGVAGCSASGGRCFSAGDAAEVSGGGGDGGGVGGEGPGGAGGAEGVGEAGSRERARARKVQA